MRKGRAKLFWVGSLEPTIVEGLAPVVPTELRLFSFGDNETTKGVFKLTEENAKKMIEWFADYGNNLVVDYEHDTWNEKISGPRPAAGWIKELFIKADGLYCRIAWTPRATELILAKEYLYTSPSFEYDEDTRELTGLLPLGLVNFPATKNMKPLIAASARSGESEERTMNKALLKALGLAEDASEVEVLAALQRWRDIGGKLCELTGKKTADEALGAVLAWKEQAAEVPALKTEVAGYKDKEKKANEEKSKVEVAAAVDKAIKDMKLVPVKREWAIKLGADNRAMLDSFLEGLPAVVGGNVNNDKKDDNNAEPRPPAGGSGAGATGKLSADSKRAFGLLGLSQKAIEELEKEGEIALWRT